MNILVTGANGQLGRHFRLLAPQSQYDWLFTDVEELDITSPDAVNAWIDEHSVRMIVNCAAYTNVDRAESEEDIALRINADASDSHFSKAGRASLLKARGSLPICHDMMAGSSMYFTPV